MTTEMITLIKSYIKHCLFFLLAMICVVIWSLGFTKTLILSGSFLISVANFILSGVMIDKLLYKKESEFIFIIPLKLVLLGVAVFIIYTNLTISSFFIIGFVVPLIISIFSLLKLQRKDV